MFFNSLHVLHSLQVLHFLGSTFNVYTLSVYVLHLAFYSPFSNVYITFDMTFCMVRVTRYVIRSTCHNSTMLPFYNCLPLHCYFITCFISLHVSFHSSLSPSVSVHLDLTLSLVRASPAAGQVNRSFTNDRFLMRLCFVADLLPLRPGRPRQRQNRHETKLNTERVSGCVDVVRTGF